MEDCVRVAAEEQFARETLAREQLTRGAGLALIGLSAVLEEAGATLDPAIDPLGVVLVAWAARGRRLLRAAHRVLDAGESSEAVPLFRTLIEYSIVGRWLQRNPDRLEAWVLADIDKRRLIVGRVIDELAGDPADVVALLESERATLAAERERWVEERGEPSGGVPSIETMAAQIGAGFAYQFAYRTQSQSDVHATPLSADVAYDQADNGTLNLRNTPLHALSGYDQYELGALALRDLLSAADEHLPGLMWSSGLEGVTAALTAARESDLRKHAEPARKMMDFLTTQTGIRPGPWL
jgi:hypothetical protein